VTADKDNTFGPDELAAEGGTALPDKEVMSLLDLNADLDLALDAAAPIGLAIGANANVAAPIEAAVGGNILSAGSTADAGAVQAAELHQGIVGDATATSHQTSDMTQGTDPSQATDPSSTQPAATTSTGSGFDGNLLNVNVNLDGQAHLAAPINGAVAANANVAAPIDAAVSANVGSVDSASSAVSEQSALIDQHIAGDATATGDQNSTIDQP